MWEKLLKMSESLGCETPCREILQVVDSECFVGTIPQPAGRNGGNIPFRFISDGPHQGFFFFLPITHGVVIDIPPLSFISKCGCWKLEERQMTECQPLLRLILGSESVDMDRELHGRRIRKGNPVAGNTLLPPKLRSSCFNHSWTKW